MAFCAPGVTWLAGTLAGMGLSAAFAAVTASVAWVIFCSAAGMAVFFAAADSSALVSRVASSRSAAARACSALAQPGAAGLALGVGDQVVIVLGAGVVIGQPVDAVVGLKVFEQVLDPPAAAQPGQQCRRGRGGVAGEDLQHRIAVFEQGDLPGLAVVLDGHGLIGQVQHLGGPAVAAGGAEPARRGGHGGERGAPPGDPVGVLAADGAERQRVGAAAVEPEQDLRVLAEHLAQLGQHAGQGGGKPGRLAAGEAHRPALIVGDHGAGAAGLGVAALGVPALGYRLGALVGVAGRSE